MTDQTSCHRRSSRHGYTLSELIVSLASASLLMVGLASCLLISARVFDGSSVAVVRSRAAEVQADLMADLSQATSFSARNIDSVSFTVPDVTGDAVEETISYVWRSGSNQLDLTYNGNTSTVLENVTSFDLAYAQRFMSGSVPAPTPFDANTWGDRWAEDSGGVTFESLAEAKLSYNSNSITIARPDGTTDGNLLIAAVATDGKTSTTIAAPARLESDHSGS